MTAQRFFVGETVHLRADDLADRLTGDVTSGASVTFSIADANDVDVSTTTVTTPISGNDYAADLTAPLTPGAYFAKAEASKGGADWKAKERIYVDAF